MILCPACARLYHGEHALLAPKGAAVVCEACGDPLQARRGDGRRHVTAIFGCLALLLGICAIGGRSAIVALLPNAASMFSTLGLTEGADGLRIEHVHVGLSREGDRSLLVVEGDIVNALPKSANVPELAVSLDDSSGIELYSWRAHAPKSPNRLRRTSGFSHPARIAAAGGFASPGQIRRRGG